MTTPFIHPLEHARTRDEKPFKTTFHLSERLLVGLNTLKPDQEQHLHKHEQQDKCYLVLSGKGTFTVADTTQSCGPGDLILAPAGIIHGVKNDGDEPLSFITIIAPMG